MRILVTGAQGFIGHHVLQHLTKAFHNEIVIGCQRGVPRGPFDTIVHCGAAAGPWKEPHEIVQDNFHGMLRLCNHARAWNAKIIFLSSISVFGEISVPWVNEDTPICNPNTYGLSKLFGETLLREMDIPSVSLRLPGVVGKGVRGRNFLPIIYRAIRDERLFNITNLKKRFNNIVHVDDLSKGIEELILNSIIDQQVFVLASPFDISIQKVIEIGAREFDKTPQLKNRGDTKSFCIDAVKANRAGWWSPDSVQSILIKFAREIKDESAEA